MTPDAAPARPGRKRDPAKSAAVLEAAWALFLAQGVEATSIEAIAARANVSKVTLYSHYPDKTALFRATVEMEMERIEAAQSAPADAPDDEPIADQLIRFGTGLLLFLFSPSAIDFYSVIAGELRRHPELARAFYDFGPGRTRLNLAGLLAAASAAGRLPPLDPEQGAEELFGLWQGFSNFQLSLGIDVATLQTTATVRAQRGVTAFLKIHAQGVLF